ncbi:MAG: DegQ family serine endoprotease [Lysobacter sp.]|nr:MAG: DegQ family serine endoprotease [Lysobacter sp.]
MNAKFRTLALVSATAAATAAATVILPISAVDNATTRATAAPAVAAEAAAPLVTGLPDFTRLVDRVGPAVVNIEAQGKSGMRMIRRGGGNLPDDELPEFFRRFFGPDAPFPGGPQPGGPQPGGPDDLPDGGPRPISQGSGFLISADGYVLTNHHVVDGADEVTVKLSDRRSFKAKVVGSDEQSDVAVLKISATGLPHLRVGESKTLKPGQWVVAIGSPFGLDHSVTAGIVSAVGRANPYADQRYVPFIQTDVAINRGNSGGPLLNTSGEVVGINSQIFSNSGGYMGVSFAIPMDVAMNVTEQLRTTGKVARGQIGVVVQTVPDDAVKAYGLPDSRGALVNDVRRGGPGEKAGLEPGDVIRAVNGMPVDDSSDLPPMIGAMAPGSSVKLDILRNGKPIERTLTLSKLDESAIAGNAPRRAADDDTPAPAKAGNRLGLAGQDLDADDRGRLGLRSGEGVALARVESAAARSAGLRPGDVVLRVGSTPVGSADALDRELSKSGESDTVMLLVRRGGANQFVAITPIADRGRP